MRLEKGLSSVQRNGCRSPSFPTWGEAPEVRDTPLDSDGARPLAWVGFTLPCGPHFRSEHGHSTLPHLARQ